MGGGGSLTWQHPIFATKKNQSRQINPHYIYSCLYLDIINILNERKSSSKLTYPKLHHCSTRLHSTTGNVMYYDGQSDRKSESTNMSSVSFPIQKRDAIEAQIKKTHPSLPRLCEFVIS